MRERCVTVWWLFNYLPSPLDGWACRKKAFSWQIVITDRSVANIRYGYGAFVRAYAAPPDLFVARWQTITWATQISTVGEEKNSTVSLMWARHKSKWADTVSGGGDDVIRLMHRRFSDSPNFHTTVMKSSSISLGEANPPGYDRRSVALFVFFFAR